MTVLVWWWKVIETKFVWTSWNSSFRERNLGISTTADGGCSHEIKRRLLLGRKVMTNLDSISSRDITLPTKVLLVKAMLSTKVLKLLNCGVGEDSWESLNCKEIQPVHSEGNLSWVFIGKTDAEAESLILWPPHAKSWLIGKDSDAGRDWGQEEKGTTEDEVARWHHWLGGHGFGWTPGDGDGQPWCAAVQTATTTTRPKRRLGR